MVFYKRDFAAFVSLSQKMHTFGCSYLAMFILAMSMMSDRDMFASNAWAAL